jgi:hypothetical protein
MAPHCPAFTTTGGPTQKISPPPATSRNSSYPKPATYTLHLEGSQTQSFTKTCQESACSKIIQTQETSRQSSLGTLTDWPGSLSTFYVFKKMNRSLNSRSS